MGSVKTLQDRFRDYYENFIQAEIDSKKTARGKEKYIVARDNNLKFIDRNNKQALYFAIATYMTLQTAKTTILQKLDRYKVLVTLLEPIVVIELPHLKDLLRQIR